MSNKYYCSLIMILSFIFSSGNDNNIESMYSNLVRTDGYSIDFVFCRRKKLATLKDARGCTLGLGDFTMDEVKSDHKTYFIDPERKHVFTAISEDDEVRRCSSKKYYTMTGLFQRNKAFDREKKHGTIKEIETNIFIPKSANIEKYTAFVKYMLLNINVLFAFYGSKGQRIHSAYIKADNKLKKRW
jgi:hypothetical protein